MSSSPASYLYEETVNRAATGLTIAVRLVMDMPSFSLSIRIP